MNQGTVEPFHVITVRVEVENFIAYDRDGQKKYSTERYGEGQCA